MDKSGVNGGINIGSDRYMTSDEINEFIGHSGSESDGSDWDGLEEAGVTAFQNDKTDDVKEKRTFEKRVNTVKVNTDRKSVASILESLSTRPKETPTGRPKTAKDPSTFVAVPTRIRVT